MCYTCSRPSPYQAISRLERERRAAVEFAIGETTRGKSARNFGVGLKETHWRVCIVTSRNKRPWYKFPFHWGIYLRQGQTVEYHHLCREVVQSGEHQVRQYSEGEGLDPSTWREEVVGGFDGQWLTYVRFLLESFDYRCTQDCRFWVLSVLYRLATVDSITGVTVSAVDKITARFYVLDKARWTGFLRKYKVEFAKNRDPTDRRLKGEYDWVQLSPEQRVEIRLPL